VIALGIALAPLGMYVADLVNGTNLKRLEPALSIQAMIHAYAGLIPETLQAFAEAHNELEVDIENEERQSAQDSSV
jgi:DNA-binding transcriptional LysR family regulator